MVQFSGVGSLHPLIIHFPIALLLIVPVFIIVGALLQPAKGRAYLVAAMVLLLAGTAAIYLAIKTGEAAGRLAERVPGVEQVIEIHESLAERTRKAADRGELCCIHRDVARKRTFRTREGSVYRSRPGPTGFI